MTWFKLYVKYSLSGIKNKYVKADDMWDLFAFIGYLYSTSFEHIERIDYQEVSQNEVAEKADASEILNPAIRKQCIRNLYNEKMLTLS